MVPALKAWLLLHLIQSWDVSPQRRKLSCCTRRWILKWPSADYGNLTSGPSCETCSFWNPNVGPGQADLGSRPGVGGTGAGGGAEEAPHAKGGT